MEKKMKIKKIKMKKESNAGFLNQTRRQSQPCKRRELSTCINRNRVLQVLSFRFHEHIYDNVRLAIL